MRLGAAALPALGLPGPAYDRGAVQAGIVHLGLGGFARSHLAVYVDRLLAAGAREWGVCGVGTQPADRRLRDALRAQDHLYTLVVRHPDGRQEARVVGAVTGHLYAPEAPGAVVEQLASPTTRVVSLTITEGAYQVDPATGRFAPTEPALLLDLQPGARPLSVPGLLTEALVRRRDLGLAPFTVLSLDNVQRNGEVAREALAGFAALRDPALGAWVREAVAFPSSMVDRITPVTTDADRDALAERTGVRDEAPVVCEPYLQWVLEDAFGEGGRPALETVGVQLVQDVHPYEQMKLRLLNAGHQVVGQLGSLAGHSTTDEVLHDDGVARLLMAYLEREASPTLPPVPGVDLAAYRRSLLERFGNPFVRDTLARLRAESSDRIPTFVLPAVRERLATGGDVALAALVVAAWRSCARGTDERGRPLPVVDRLLETITAAAASRDPVAFLTGTGVFGGLEDDPRFVAAYVEQVRRLDALGVAGAVREALA